MKLLELSKPGILVKKIASSNWQRNLSGVVASLMKLFELLKPGVFSQEDCMEHTQFPTSGKQI